MLTPELFFYAGSNLLEGPVWRPEENAIYCVAIDQCLIYRIALETKIVRTYKTGGHIGCVVPDGDDHFIVAEKDGLFRLHIETGDRTFLYHPEENELLRYNDGKRDPRGRFLVGTKGYLEEFEGAASLYSVEGKISRKIIKEATISNGLGFSADGSYLYYIDTPTKKVARYHYDLEDGTAVFDRYIIEIPGPGYPDGLCVDKDGMIWVAEWEGGRVCKWNPETGDQLQEINLPCKRVTSCCIGGVDDNYLFITTAKDHENPEPMAGGLFRVKLV